MRILHRKGSKTDKIGGETTTVHIEGRLERQGRLHKRHITWSGCVTQVDHRCDTMPQCTLASGRQIAWICWLDIFSTGQGSTSHYLQWEEWSLYKKEWCLLGHYLDSWSFLFQRTTWYGIKDQETYADCQAGTICGASLYVVNSTQNYFLIAHMLSFLWHSRQKCRI